MKENVKIDLERVNQYNLSYHLLEVFVHEIRKSLSTLKILFQSIENYLPPDGESHKAIEVANKEISRLDRLSRSFLNSVKGNEDSTKGEFELTKVKNCLEDIIYLLIPMFTTEGIELKISINLDAKCTVPIAEDKLKQVLINLLINAKEAVYEVDNPRVTVHAFIKDNMCQIEISDNGKSIESDKLEQIFEPFFSTKGQLGLGLSISNQIIKNAGGKLDVRTEKDLTVFSLALPIVKD